MKNITAILFLIPILFVGCSLSKTARIMKKGEVVQQEFKVEIPFEYRLGLIVIEVEIDGTEYDFMLDTGAPNVLSTELAWELQLIPVASFKTSDSQGEHSKLEYVLVDQINIGGISFQNTGAAVADLNASNVIGCIKIDGLIGANLMRKAIWEIDYENQKITITNSLSSLDVPDGGKTIPFNQKVSGTPQIEIDLNGQKEKYITVDLGSNGDFDMSLSTYKKLLKNDTLTSTTFGYGRKSSGLYGLSKPDTTKYAIVPDMSFGDIILNNKIVSFQKDKSSLAGTNFFKNYRLIFDWFNEELIMIETKEYKNTRYDNFGFSPNFSDNKLIIGFLFNQSSADKAGLKLGDQIIGINEKDYREITLDGWCEILNQKLIAEDVSSISITVLRDGENLTFDLTKSMILTE